MLWMWSVGYECKMFVLSWSIVFFFKQKTAYEMRISDWSSDVCSSDLHGAHGAGAEGMHHRQLRHPVRQQRGRRHRNETDRQPHVAEMQHPDQRLAAGPPALPACQQIGRASCRDSVSQSV